MRRGFNFGLSVFWVAALTLSISAAAAEFVRPGGGAEPTKVEFGVLILDVDDIDSANQVFTANVYVELKWNDPRLVREGDGTEVRLLSDVWHPRLGIVNQQRLWKSFADAVEVEPDGTVVYRQRIWGQFSQPLRLYDFPFDAHVFNIQLAATRFSTDEVEFVPSSTLPSGIAEEHSVADWKITEWEAAPRAYVPAAGLRGSAGFRVAFTAQRERGYFVAKVIIPLLLIVAMSWVVFWIDPQESGTQISVSVTAMLTLIAYRFAVGTSLPKVSYLTRLDYVILASTLLVFASLIEVVITSSFSKHGKLSTARTIDKVCRILFPIAFASVALQNLVLGVRW